MHGEALRRIIHLLETPTSEVDADERLRIAAGALLVECARVDSGYSDAERSAVAAAMVQIFGLGAEVAEVLVAIAERRADDVWHDWILTEAVKRGFDVGERRMLIHKLWKVAAVNGAADPRQEQFVLRIARELEVSDEDVAAIRKAVMRDGVDTGGHDG